MDGNTNGIPAAGDRGADASEPRSVGSRQPTPRGYLLLSEKTRFEASFECDCEACRGIEAQVRALWRQLEEAPCEGQQGR